MCIKKKKCNNELNNKTGVNSNINYGLQVRVTCQCDFIHCDKRTALVGGVANGGGCTYVGSGGKWEIFIPLAQCYCEPKTALKK